MTATRFWRIIEASKKGSKGSRGRQERALRGILESLKPREIVAFSLWFDAYIRRAYNWDLWGAAYIFETGCSDDGFWDFRSWLVSQGKKVYEAVVRNPDSLADLSKYNKRSSWLNFMDPGWLVLNEKLGIPEETIGVFPCLGSNLGETPKGRRFGDSVEQLKARYPKLWKKFGWKERRR